MSIKKNSKNGSPSRTLIYDIAERSGVSTATVSRVLNGRPDVSEATREKVMLHAKELGYIASRRFSSVNVSYISLITPYVQTLYFASILQGIIDTLERNDARMILRSTYNHQETADEVLQKFQDDNSIGGIMILPSHKSSELEALQKTGFPFVVIDPVQAVSEAVPVVTSANITGARMGTEHLLSLGHRRIGIITGPTYSSASNDRLAGFHSMLLANNVPYNPEYIRNGNFTVRDGSQAALELLKLPEPPTAIFAFSDQMALGVLHVAREMGIRVPDDLSVIGFDDEDFTAFITPELTTIRQPLMELGRVGVDLLYNIINGNPLDVARVELSTRLIVRKSTAECKQ